MKRIKWIEVWFHDKSFKNNIPELVAKFTHLGDARIFFNQFYPQYADRECTVSLTQGNIVIHQMAFGKD